MDLFDIGLFAMGLFLWIGGFLTGLALGSDIRKFVIKANDLLSRENRQLRHELDNLYFPGEERNQRSES